MKPHGYCAVCLCAHLWCRACRTTHCQCAWSTQACPKVPPHAASSAEPARELAVGELPDKALSIQQPWAWLIVNGYKDGVENRTWATKVRGDIAIHAGKQVDAEGDRWVRETFPEIPLPPLKTLERGGIVGRARLVDCVASMASPWFFGPYGFVFQDPAPLPFVPLRGQLGFFSPVGSRRITSHVADSPRHETQKGGSRPRAHVAPCERGPLGTQAEES